MAVYLESETETGFPFDAEALSAQILETVLEAEKFPWEADLSILLTTEDEIRSLNQRTRSIDAETDVLSFPLCSFPGPFDPERDGEDCLCVDPDSGAVLLGDIAMCVPRLRSQAAEYGHSLRREYAFLMVHSVLHLLGYDHIGSGDREQMEARQRALMEILQIPRET